MSDILAWHFVGDTLRDGRPVPADGELLKQAGKIVPCERGLHGSVKLRDAVSFAPGTTLCRVRLGGTVRKHGGDKHAASERTILWRFDALALLREYARECAKDVLHLWTAPKVVRRFLETGDPNDAPAASRAARGYAVRAAAYAALTAGGSAAAYAARAAYASAYASQDPAYAAVTQKQNERLTARVTEAAAKLGYSV